jgi:hypothetical protein
MTRVGPARTHPQVRVPLWGCFLVAFVTGLAFTLGVLLALDIGGVL